MADEFVAQCVKIYFFTSTNNYVKRLHYLT